MTGVAVLKMQRLSRCAGILLLSLACIKTVSASDLTGPVSTVAPTHASEAAKSKAGTAKSSSTAKNSSRPYWNDLKPDQRVALAPLANEWNKLDAFRKEKWLELANKFSSMSPPEQARMHERMQDWVSLSPEQRRQARENYARVKKLPPEQRSAQWEQYQQLPEEKKKELAATVPAKKPIVNPPLGHGKQQTKTNTKPVPAKQPIPKQEGIQPSTLPAPPPAAPAAAAAPAAPTQP